MAGSNTVCLQTQARYNIDDFENDMSPWGQAL